MPLSVALTAIREVEERHLAEGKTASQQAHSHFGAITPHHSNDTDIRIPCHIQLTGGEPTLEPERLRQIVRAIRQSRLKATIALQSNGTSLDTDLIHFLQDHDVQLGLSIDGSPKVQEQLRGSSQALLRSLERLEQHAMPFRVTSVLTQDSLPLLEQLPLFLGQYTQAQGIAFDLPVFKGRLQPSMFPTHNTLAKALQRFCQSFRLVNAHRTSALTLRELEQLRQHQHLRKQYATPQTAAPNTPPNTPPDAQSGAQTFGQPLGQSTGQTLGQPRHVRVHDSNTHPSYCYAARGESLAIAPDGSRSLCGQLLGNPSSVPANPHSDTPARQPCSLKPLPDTETLASQSLHALADCNTCILQGACPGDCPSRLQHNPPAVQTLACTLYQTLWKELHA